MMILILLLISAGYCVEYNQVKIDELMEIRSDMMRECLVEAGVSEDKIKEFLGVPNFLLGSRINGYRKCFGIKLGYVNEDGDIQREKITQDLTDTIVNKNRLQKILSDCLIQKETHEETLYSIFECVFPNSTKVKNENVTVVQ